MLNFPGISLFQRTLDMKEYLINSTNDFDLILVNIMRSLCTLVQIWYLKQNNISFAFDTILVLVFRNITLHLLGNWLALILSRKLPWFITFQRPFLVLWQSGASGSRAHFVRKILTRSMQVWEWISTTMVQMSGLVFAWTLREWFSFALPLFLWSFCQVLLLGQVYSPSWSFFAKHHG